MKLAVIERLEELHYWIHSFVVAGTDILSLSGLISYVIFRLAPKSYCRRLRAMTVCFIVIPALDFSVISLLDKGISNNTRDCRVYARQ